MYFAGKFLKNELFFNCINRCFAQKFYLERLERAITKDYSFIINAFCGKIEPSQIFPYPNTLNTEQRETLKKITQPVEQFFYEIDNKGPKDGNTVDALKRLWELGAFSLQVPKNLGGLGLCNTQYARLVEIVGAHDLGVGITLGAHQSMGYKGILLFGSDIQKTKYLAKVTSGEFAAFCLTEPSCGSDISSLATRAELSADGKHYVLNGCKVWIACKNDKADIMTVFAKTSITAGKLPKPGENITAFIVEKGYSGITYTPSKIVDEDKTTNTIEVRFENVKIPLDNILGGIGNGYKVAMSVLNNGRFGMVASLAGTMRSCTNKAIQFVNTQNLFGDKMYTFASIQEKLSRMAMYQYATEAMAYVISSNMDKGSSSFSIEAAISKCFASEAAWYVCDEALEIMGGIGYLKETELERILKDLRTFRIFEGTNDILRLYIALTGVQHATPYIDELKKALKTPSTKYNFILKELWNKTLSILGLNSFFKVNEGCHSDLTYSAYQLGRAIDYFSLAITYVIISYGKSLETQQHLLNQIANCAIDIYSSACVLSRASNSLNNKLVTSNHEAMMVKFWIKETSERIIKTSRNIMSKKHLKNRNNLNYISKKICETGKIPTRNPLNL